MNGIYNAESVVVMPAVRLYIADGIFFFFFLTFLHSISQHGLLSEKNIINSKWLHRQLCHRTVSLFCTNWMHARCVLSLGFLNGFADICLMHSFANVVLNVD